MLKQAPPKYLVVARFAGSDVPDRVVGSAATYRDAVTRVQKDRDMQPRDTSPPNWYLIWKTPGWQLISQRREIPWTMAAPEEGEDR